MISAYCFGQMHYEFDTFKTTKNTPTTPRRILWVRTIPSKSINTKYR